VRDIAVVRRPVRKRDVRNFETHDADGAPQVTPVWVDRDEETGALLVNMARGRRKERNVEVGASVALSMLDPEDPYRYLSVTGSVTAVTAKGAADHIDELARRYMGTDEYPHHGDENGERVVIRIVTEAVRTGGD